MHTKCTDRFFLDTFRKKNKTDTSISFNDKDDVNNKLILSMLNRTNKYIVDILNKDLSSRMNDFLFANILVKILAKKLIDEVYVLKNKSKYL
jgi:hypothetical protein